jgi:molybdopterin converting factor small subunit
VSAEVTVRLFAAAREAAGVSEVRVAPGPIGARLHELGLGERFDAVLAVCTLLCDGRRLEPADEVAAGRCVDVLPPFAGG